MSVTHLLRRLRPRTPVLVAAGAALAALGLVTTSTLAVARAESGDDCARGVQRLAVVVAPEIAPAATAAAAELRRRSDGCVRVDVAAQPAGEVAGALAAGRARPQAWLPDSTVWLTALTRAGVRLPADRPSVASSPVVLAVARGVAERLGWPGRHVDLATLAGTAQRRPVRWGVPDPAHSAAAVAALLGTRAVLQPRADGPATLAALLRTGRTDLPADPARLLAGLAGAAALTVPVTEQAVVAHNRRAGRIAAVAAYPAAPALSLDYPLLTLAGDPAAQSVAQRLLGVLTNGPAAARLARDGFRTPAGGAPPAVDLGVGVDPAAPVTTAAPPATSVADASRVLDLVRRRSRMLAVIDVSGSMGAPVPGAGGRTRLDLTKEAASLGMAAYADDAEVGLWVFATRLAGRADHRQLVPVGPLGPRGDGRTGRALLAGALATLRPAAGGGTALYDTTLAAVRAARSGWRPGRVNSVVLLTDGENADPDGIALSTLLRALRSEHDPRRPVPVITIAYGPGSDVAALRAISRATGGGAYQARNPLQIQQVLMDAIGRRVCRPDC